MDLPAEPRLMVYKCLSVQQERPTIWPEGSDVDLQDASIHIVFNRHHLPLQIPRVCRALSDEACEIMVQKASMILDTVPVIIWDSDTIPFPTMALDRPILPFHTYWLQALLEDNHSSLSQWVEISVFHGWLSRWWMSSLLLFIHQAGPQMLSRREGSRRTIILRVRNPARSF